VSIIRGFPTKSNLGVLALVAWLAVALAGGRASAAPLTTNGTLISVTLSNGTPVMPRTIFSQTWTFENTGTATWTATYNGYTLNMTSKDSLGAIPLSPKPYVSSEPSAEIDNGLSVAPGAKTTYTMDFIAPETSGSYTDTFQLNSSSSLFFGPTVTVQVVVMKAGSTNQYDRGRAVSYANNYSAYVCTDGYFWTNGSTFGTFTPGSPAPSSGLGDDCAHFCSCCIGQPPTVWGGGLNIPTRDVTYGEPGAAHLAYTDLILPGYAVEVYSLTNMEPGDLVGWNWENETNITLLDHVTFYLGNGLLASHSASDLGVSATTWYNGVHHYIHILDSPTVFASKTGNKLVLSWGTNWNNYAMYSSTSLSSGATWTKMSGAKVAGVMNVMTNTISSGTVFYHLMMP
jgi:hypothetical protein